MSKRLLIYGFHEPELASAVELAIQDCAVVAHWIGRNGPQRTFDEDIIQWHLGQIELDSHPSKSTHQTAEGIIAANWPQLREQLVRNPACQSIDDESLHLFAVKLAVKFLHVLRDQRIDQLFFQNLPHEGFEYALYLAARHLGLPTVMCYQSVLPNRFFYCRDLCDFGFFQTCDSVPVVDIQVPRTFRKKLFYMENVPLVSEGGLSLKERIEHLRYWIKAVKQRLGYYRLINKRPRSIDPDREYAWQMMRTIDKRFKLTRPYVYFPLHLQPELTTSAIGHHYFDQLLAVEELSAWLPRGVSLVLKENPKQDHRWRNAEFFQRIRKLKNVVLVPTQTDTYELLEQCQFAATITGTVGWEAISGGKNVVVFGHPWYLSLPGVHYWRRKPKYEEVLNRSWDHTEFCQAVSELAAKGRLGIVDVNYCRAAPDHDPACNTHRIAAFIRSELISANVAEPMV